MTERNSAIRRSLSSPRLSSALGENLRILSINVGSSSIKFAVFECGDQLERLAAGAIDRIGLPDASMSVTGTDPADNFTRLVAAPDFEAAAKTLIGWVEQRSVGHALAAIGHRVVHGGPKFSEPLLLTLAAIDALRSLSPFDPQHLPQEILVIEAFQRQFPKLLQVACFDTDFFHDLPRVAQMLAIPRRYEAQGVRRYGFHGLSYAYLMEELARQAGEKAAPGRTILAHLGNGASLAAVKDGRPVDTSMGFTPAAGIPMGTRSGDLDPGLISYFARSENMSPKKFDQMINFQSGLLGISETSSDMRELLHREGQDVRAAEAVALFCYQARKWIGAFTAALGGLDQLVFAGGVGENAPVVRSRICEGLEFLGIEIDAKRNAEDAPLISRDAGRVKVHVIPTDEEIMIARHASRILALGPTGTP